MPRSLGDLVDVGEERGELFVIEGLLARPFGASRAKEQLHRRGLDWMPYRNSCGSNPATRLAMTGAGRSTIASKSSITSGNCREYDPRRETWLRQCCTRPASPAKSQIPTCCDGGCVRRTNGEPERGTVTARMRGAIAHAFLNYLQENTFPRKRAVSSGATRRD